MNEGENHLRKDHPLAPAKAARPPGSVEQGKRLINVILVILIQAGSRHHFPRWTCSAWPGRSRRGVSKATVPPDRTATAGSLSTTTVGDPVPSGKCHTRRDSSPR